MAEKGVDAARLEAADGELRDVVVRALADRGLQPWQVVFLLTRMLPELQPDVEVSVGHVYAAYHLAARRRQ